MQKSFIVSEETIQEALDNIKTWDDREVNGFREQFNCPIYNSIPGHLRVGYNYIKIDEIYECTPELEQWQREGAAGKNPGSIRVILDDMNNGRKVARLRRIK